MKFTLKKESAAADIQVGGAPRVNLLPRAVAEKRAQRALLFQWAVRIGGALAVLVLAVAGMFAWQGIVTLQLGNVQAEGARALEQIAAKSDIQQLLDTENELQSFAEDAVVTHLVWAETMGSIVAHVPEGSALCGFSLMAGNAPEGEPEEQTGLSGAVEICGASSSAIPFLANVIGNDNVLSAAVVEGEFDTQLMLYRHTLAITLDQTVYQSVQHQRAAAEESAA